MPLSLLAALIALGCAPSVLTMPQAGPIATVIVCPPPIPEAPTVEPLGEPKG